MWRSLPKHFVSNTCCQSLILASVEKDRHSECPVELELGLEAEVSALPDGVKS